MLDSLTGSAEGSTPGADEDTQLVIDVYGGYETARSGARHAVEHRQPTGAAAGEMEPGSSKRSSATATPATSTSWSPRPSRPRAWPVTYGSGNWLSKS